MYEKPDAYMSFVLLFLLQSELLHSFAGTELVLLWYVTN